MYSTELEEYYINEYCKLHNDESFVKKGWIYGYGDGKTTANKAKYIGELVNKYNARSILDYGCGKAIHHTQKGFYDSLGVFDVGLYDPAIKDYSILPDRMYDGVVCVDVLEHIPEQNVDYTLNKIINKATSFVFFSISCNPARITLSDGSNAHTTQREPSWWVDKLSAFTIPIYAILSYDVVKKTYYHIKTGWSCDL